MEVLNIRDPGGVVHLGQDAFTSYCQHLIKPGWTFISDVVTCINCLALMSAANNFSRRVAHSVARRTFMRCRDEIRKLQQVQQLRPGDTVDFKHDFQIRSLVEINKDGSVTIKEPP